MRNGQCARCQVAAVVSAAAPGGVPAALGPLLDEMLWDDPSRGIRWLRASPVARLLLSLLAAPEVTHEALDAAAQGTAGRRATDRLRGLLAASGALPFRDSGLSHYEDRVAEILAAVPAASQMAVRRYARWAVTRPLQERAASGETPSADLIRWPLARIRAAAQFTAGLAAAGQSLGTVTQSHLDAWIAEIPGSGPVLRGFVNWAAAHGYMAAGLEIPWRSSREDRRGMHDEERLALAGRLLRTQEGDSRDRLGAVLILLFGQQATRVARLKTNAVSIDADGRVHIALGDTPVRLREPLAHLAVTVADDARHAGSPWLFPGENGPMSSDRFRDRLGKVGVGSVQMARNSALAAFAADVPPALLADKLGLSISAAVAWSKSVGAARADYAGLRNGPADRKRGQALPVGSLRLATIWRAARLAFSLARHAFPRPCHRCRPSAPPLCRAAGWPQPGRCSQACQRPRRIAPGAGQRRRLAHRACGVLQLQDAGPATASTPLSQPRDPGSWLPLRPRPRRRAAAWWHPGCPRHRYSGAGRCLPCASCLWLTITLPRG
jgi:hypothetical protein